MALRRSIWLPILTLLLSGCGGEETSPRGSAAKGGPTLTTTTASALRRGVVGSPLTDLTAERLDEFVAILKKGAEHPAKSAGMIAMDRHWKIADWTALYASVSALAQAGSFDALLERTRTKLADSQKQIDLYEKEAAKEPDGRRSFLSRSADALRKAQAGWRRMLEQAEAMRPGGALVEARMDEIKAALGK